MAGQRGKGQIGPEDKMICKKIIAQFTIECHPGHMSFHIDNRQGKVG